MCEGASVCVRERGRERERKSVTNERIDTSFLIDVSSNCSKHYSVKLLVFRVEVKVLVAFW